MFICPEPRKKISIYALWGIIDLFDKKVQLEPYRNSNNCIYSDN